ETDTAAGEESDNAETPAGAHIGILLRHVGWEHVPVCVAGRRRGGEKGPAAHVRAGRAVAVWPGSGLGGKARGSRKRQEPRGLFSGQNSADAEHARYELHSPRREI